MWKKYNLYLLYIMYVIHSTFLHSIIKKYNSLKYARDKSEMCNFFEILQVSEKKSELILYLKPGPVISGQPVMVQNSDIVP